MKQMVDRIVDELEQEPRVKKLYQSWGTVRRKSGRPIPISQYHWNHSPSKRN
ncbi:MAG: hypothetical protein ACLR0U_06870 [Enterocloster clostridioformis]